MSADPSLSINPDDYLARLQQELKGFSAEEQAALVEEIRAHFEEGQADPRQGPAEQRDAKLQAEMGSPADLGRGFKEVYRPNRWLDFLLVFVPYVLIHPIQWLVGAFFAMRPETYSPIFSDPMVMAYQRVIIALNALLTIIALRRRSLPTLFFWLPQALLSTYVLVYREKRLQPESFFNTTTGGMLESAFWLLFLAGLAVWLGRLIWRERRDGQLVVLALLPFFVTLGNLALNPYLAAGLFPGGYNLPMWHITLPGGFPIGPYQIGSLIWPVLFFLFPRRDVRWLGLALWSMPLALMNFVAALQYPQLAAVWMLPVVLVLAGWLIDTRAHSPGRGVMV